MFVIKFSFTEIWIQTLWSSKSLKIEEEKNSRSSDKTASFSFSRSKSSKIHTIQQKQRSYNINKSLSPRHAFKEKRGEKEREKVIAASFFLFSLWTMITKIHDPRRLITPY